MTTDAERWNERWRVASGPLGTPHSMVAALARQLPVGSSVLDVAAGRGRQTRPLLAAGHHVTAVDVSAVGLERIAAKRPQGLTPVVCDLTAALPGALDGPFDAIVCVDYRDTALWPRLHARLRVGGVLVVSIATIASLERNARPSRRFLAQDADASAILGPLQAIRVTSEWRDNGRHELWIQGVRSSA